jgi:hypothetical protein
MPYPTVREHPERIPCVKKFRGNSVGVREAAKNSIPRRRPPVENECQNPLLMRSYLSIQVSASFVRQLVASDLMAQAAELRRLHNLAARTCPCRSGSKGSRAASSRELHPCPPTGSTVNEGMVLRLSTRRRRIFTGARIGRVSQATKVAQAIRDARGARACADKCALPPAVLPFGVRRVSRRAVRVPAILQKRQASK